MKEYTYILINFFTIIICFIFSFHPKIKFNNYFKSFIMAAVVVAIPFILWDAWFTQKGVWWFNENYTLGINFAGLPLEEILFFICIPFSCVFTYFCLNKFFNLDSLQRFNAAITYLTIAVCLAVAIIFHDKIYPFVTALSTLFTIGYLHFIAKVNWIAKASLIYTILMLGFFPVNGILTGTGIESPIVNYNPADFLNFRIGTIPIEDAVYGYTLFLLNIYFFNYFSRTKTSMQKSEEKQVLQYSANETKG